MSEIFSRRVFLRRRLRRICVRGICAQMCAGEFARNLCPDFVRRNVRGNFVQICAGENLRAELCRGCSSTLCAGVRREIFSSGMRAGVFFLSPMCAGMFSGMGGGIRVRKWAPGGPGGPKRAKKGQKCPKWPKMAQNGQKGGGARKWPKMAHFVPEWYTSGSGATAFDSTGWQKSPEYALIRIAAGPLFPPGTKVADLPKWQKSPILAPPESRRFRPGWQKSPISPPSESGASSVARSLLEKLSARLSPSSQSLHGRLLTDSRGGRARVAHVTCATVTHAHAPHSLKTPVRVHDCAHPHTHPTRATRTHPTHSRTHPPTQRHNVTTLSHGRHRRGIAHIKVLLCV